MPKNQQKKNPPKFDRNKKSDKKKSAQNWRKFRKVKFSKIRNLFFFS
jgi:ribosomal protein L32E